MNSKTKNPEENAKIEQLKQYQKTNADGKLTNVAGLKISDDQRTLRAGKRGPTLFQDFHFFKKQSHLSRERIPEKVVHARGFGVHGTFVCTKSMKKYTKADFLQQSGTETPVFVRFSNFIGNKGSKDTAIDVRGFATKFYTKEGNYDNLCLSFAVFVLTDAMKFADFVHAVKQNPTTDVPQATIAHDNAWDYIANNPESAHFIMWLMSGRGRPRSWRMMEGYPINTFKFINEQGKVTFVRFVWKPTLGVHSLLLEEANIIGGIDPDYHRNDIIEAIENKIYPEYQLGVQLIPEKDEFRHDFDILDDSKLWPEEIVPVMIVGKMTLNKLVDNFFAEEEQSSFDPSNLVSGLDFSNDPVLQGRSFAYRDTDYHRLGTANIEDIPINKPLVDTKYNVRDGYSKIRIDVDRTHYHNNALSENKPEETPQNEGGYAHYEQTVEGNIARDFPSDSFTNYFSQARLFFNSLSAIEKQHLTETFIFHLAKVKSKDIRQQNVEMFANVDKGMATQIANAIGVKPPSISHVNVKESSPVLSMDNTIYSPSTQKVGILIANGFEDKEVKAVLKALKQNNVFFEVVSDMLGNVVGSKGTKIEVDKTFITTSPVLYDSIYIVGGKIENQAKFDREVTEFANMAIKHYKPIGIATTGKSYVVPSGNQEGIIYSEQNDEFPEQFIKAIAQQRFWNRT